MARLSSMQTGTDITVEPKLVSKPVAEMTDDELLEEMEKLRGMRGVAAQASKRSSSGPRQSAPVNLTEIG